MAAHTGIVWTDATWNPVTGCTKVSPGCKHCYAERDWARLAANPKTRYHGREFTDVQYHMDVLELPLHWKKPRRIFVNSMSDLFHEDVPTDVIADVFGIMAAARHHTFQVLTKRPERMRYELSDWGFRGMVDECAAMYSGAIARWPLPNVWIGVSVEDQATAEERIPLLIETPAEVRWISAEPLLGSLNLYDWIGPWGTPEQLQAPAMLDWIVVGGESGPKARPMHPEWVRILRDQCAVAGVPFLFKQWSEWGFGFDCVEDTRGDEHLTYFLELDRTFKRVGKKAAGRLLDGRTHDQYPDVSAKARTTP